MEVCLHPRHLHALFGFKKQVSTVFRDILGLHDIHHLSITRVDHYGEILSFSSTPALEFNVFNTMLWRYDRAYQLDWLRQGLQSSWHSLYGEERFDELYYVKQLKYGFHHTQSLALRIGVQHYLFSFASRAVSEVCSENVWLEKKELYKIGRYCLNLLIPYFEICNPGFSQVLLGSDCYEVSN